MGQEFVFVPFGFVFIIIIGVAVRLLVGSCNHARIKWYIESKSGNVLDIQWVPFGPGWFGSQYDYIYRVHFRDCYGNDHLAYCKTSMFAGVYLTEDKIVGTKLQPQDSISLEDENRRLKEEIRRLKNER